MTELFDIDTDLALKIGEGVSAAVRSGHVRKFSNKIKPSNLGGDCIAYIWYEYRHVRLGSDTAADILRYSTGQKAESRFTDLLLAAGWTITSVDPKTGEQFKLKDIGGHLVGFLDGIASHPKWTHGQDILAEYKTMNQKNFNLLVSKGVNVSHHYYYVQMIVYLMYFNLPWCLMMTRNKNTDELHYEVVYRNDAMAQGYLKRAETVIHSKTRPARLAESATYFKCKKCTFVGICHGADPVAINCRSCIFASAADGGWFCDKWQKAIPKTAIPVGCPQHTPVK